VAGTPEKHLEYSDLLFLKVLHGADDAHEWIGLEARRSAKGEQELV